MLTICWSPKGGNGTTVVACALALVAGDALLIDLSGDAPGALGLADPAGPGIHDWIASTSAEPPAIEALAVGTEADLRVVPCGTAAADLASPRWVTAGKHLAARPGTVIVDGGSGCAPPPRGLLDVAHRRLMVLRPCYLALRKAASCGFEPTGVVLIDEPGRSLRADDVHWAVHAPVVAQISLDPAIARAVDAGLLASRMPRSLSAPLRQVLA